MIQYFQIKVLVLEFYAHNVRDIIDCFHLVKAWMYFLMCNGFAVAKSTGNLEKKKYVN